MSDVRPIALRAFSWDDMPALIALWVESWQEAMPEIDFEARRGWICHRIGSLLDEGARVEIAVEAVPPESNLPAAGLVLGFVTVDPRTGHVDQLAVHPDHWGEGIAMTLLAAARQASPDHLRLEVNEENARAVGFYRKAGFVVTGRGANPLSGRPTLGMEWQATQAG